MTECSGIVEATCAYVKEKPLYVPKKDSVDVSREIFTMMCFTPVALSLSLALTRVLRCFSGVHLEIKDLNQRDYFFDIKNLSYPIVPEQSSYKLKSESIVLNLKKKESKEWECVTAAEKAAKDKK